MPITLTAVTGQVEAAAAATRNEVRMDHAALQAARRTP